MAQNNLNDPFEKQVDLDATKDDWFCETQMFTHPPNLKEHKQVTNFCNTTGVVIINNNNRRTRKVCERERKNKESVFL